MKTTMLLATLSLALGATAFAQDDVRPRRQGWSDEYTARDGRSEPALNRPGMRRYQGEFGPGQGRYRQGDAQFQGGGQQRLRLRQHDCECPNCPVGRANLRAGRATGAEDNFVGRQKGPRWAPEDNNAQPGQERGRAIGPRGRGFGGPPQDLGARPGRRGNLNEDPEDN